jgi:DNA-binding transcriptional MerR regulator
LRYTVTLPYYAFSVQSPTPLVVDPPAEQEIPDKLYFRIGDVSRLAGVKAYVLRYWETEFPAIAPKKSGTGQRLYRRKDVELILEIKHLLYEKRFTIEGARKAIEDRAKPVAAPKRVPKAVATTQTSLFGTPGPDLSAIRRELEDILAILK